MNHGFNQSHDRLSEFNQKFPDGHTIPGYLTRDLDIANDYTELSFKELREQVKGDLVEMMEPYGERRRAEQQLAGYIETVAQGIKDNQKLKDELEKVAASMHDCRTTGRLINEDENIYIAWDNQCGHSKLCPDESREESQRLAEFYLPELLEYKNASGLNRIFYSVFTVPNYDQGKLAEGKKAIIEKFKDWSKSLPYYAQNPNRKHKTDKHDQSEYAGAFCPVTFDQVKGKMKAFRSLKKEIVFPPDPIRLDGSLIIEEDPLSASNTWNVHLNVFLLVNQSFDYSLARSLWGNHLWFKELPKNIHELRKALLEAIKYSAQIVPMKSQDKADQGSDAPWMIDWNPDTWLEWYQANKLFRRTRSYGCLYKVHEKKWNKMNGKERAQVVTWAGVAADLIGHDFDVCQWQDLYPLPQGALTEEQHEAHLKERNKIKVKLRKAMIHGEPDEGHLTGQLVGSVNFSECGEYKVTSIQGDNFSTGSQNNDNFLQDFNYYYDPGG